MHTYCLPTTASVTEVINTADQQAIVGMLAKFGKCKKGFCHPHNVLMLSFFIPSFSASDRAVNDTLADAKEGLVVSCVDAFETYKSYSR